MIYSIKQLRFLKDRKVRKVPGFEKITKYTALFTFLITVVCYALFRLLKIALFYAMGVSFGTICYHFTIRLLVGAVVDRFLYYRLNYDSRWFRAHRFESALYKRLRIKKWKDKMPTYNPDSFSIKQTPVTEMVQATCTAEMVHEINALLSFVPILFVPEFGAAWVFFITSVLAAVFDLLFVLIQRFNRPRLLKLIKK